MDEDARRVLELLQPAVARAEQIGEQQQALLARHEEAAQVFSSQLGELTEAAETERARLAAERAEVGALREAAVAQGRGEADVIVAAARAEEAAARARIAELQQAQAQSEAAHAAKMAAAEAERAEAEAAHLARLRQREEERAAAMERADRERAEADAEHEEEARRREAEHVQRLREREAEHQARIDRLHQQGLESVAERERAFEAACADKQERLQALAQKEAEILARVREMQDLVSADGPDALVLVTVGGRQFETTIGCLTRFPHSTLAVLWHDRRTRRDETDGATNGPLRLQGDPTLFQLILNHLAFPEELPVVSDVAQIQWLERESKRYGLDELTRQCRDAYKRLDTVKVMQLLNGQRNLSGMDMRGLDLSDIDFKGASMYRARVDDATLAQALL